MKEAEWKKFLLMNNLESDFDGRTCIDLLRVEKRVDYCVMREFVQVEKH